MKNKITKIIDLTHNIEEKMITFNAPWHSRVFIDQLGKHAKEGRETRRITFGTHTGTHMDAPLHFVKCGRSIEKVPLDLLIGEVTIVDFSFLKQNEAVTKSRLNNLCITKRMLFSFGWGKYWNTKRFYQGYPFFTQEAAQYLVSKGVKLVGMDTPSPEDSRISLRKDFLGGEQDSPAHKIFLKNNVILIEYIANLDKIRDYKDWSIIALPLRIKGVDGSPVRVCIYK